MSEKRKLAIIGRESGVTKSDRRKNWCVCERDKDGW